MAAACGCVFHVALIGAMGETTFTVYHSNPLSEGQLPLDMDTADLRGEMFFDLSNKAEPLVCKQQESGRKWKSLACQNPEEVAPDLVISKLLLTVRQPFGEYARCNICNASGVDPLSQLRCKPNAYLCSCGNFWDPKDCSHQLAVGKTTLKDAFGKGYVMCSPRTWMDAPYLCWGPHVVGITGGTWYSTTKAGWCDDPTADPSLCTWRATVVKVVNKTCSDSKIYDAVEFFDLHHDDGRRCFNSCRPPFDPSHPFKPRPFVRNTTDACWIYCYFANLLGESGLLPNGNYSGMPVALLEEAFEEPFLDEDKGGCPSLLLEEMPYPQPSAAATAWQARRSSFQTELLKNGQQLGQSKASSAIS
eukprot:scaffold205029_cov33-Tisochrysis_lutea.AAC.1